MKTTIIRRVRICYGPHASNVFAEIGSDDSQNDGQVAVKIVEYYVWDEAAQRLMKAAAGTKKPARKRG